MSSTQIEQVLREIRSKAEDAKLLLPAIQTFEAAVTKVMEGDSGLVPESEIEPVRDLVSLNPGGYDPADFGPLADQLAVIKLNGGLGTGMGLDRAKSLLRVKGERTFLDLIAEQLLGLRASFGGTRPAFYLMNSFSTRADSLQFLEKYPELVGDQGRLDFLQGRVPKLRADSLLPAECPANPDLEWCPPGHGDIYPSLIGSGLLEDLLARGVRYLFVSNSDNLGATVDAALLKHFAESEAGFMMEVARRTVADQKGGHLARRLSDGRLVLRELAQCPPESMEVFQDIDRYCYFNTNNLWIQLERLQEALAGNQGVFSLPIIQNRKTLDPRDKTSAPVIQLESAMGAAIECFENATAVEVPRTRFSPVKTTSDLLSLWSDAYVMTEDSRLQLSPERAGQPPLVTLDPTHFKLVQNFEQRFAAGVPSLIECVSLKVEGDVTFSDGVVCRGRVEISAPDGPRTLKTGVYHDEKVIL